MVDVPNVLVFGGEIRGGRRAHQQRLQSRGRTGITEHLRFCFHSICECVLFAGDTAHYDE